MWHFSDTDVTNIVNLNNVKNVFNNLFYHVIETHAFD